MARREFRNTLESCIVEIDDIDSKYEYININDVLNILDNIEQEVNKIRDGLSSYKNLTEINDIYERVDKLSDKLY